jgi:hypothetical protein
MVEPMVVEPVVRNVVAGSEPLDERAPYAVVASVDLKDGVEVPLSQLLAAETVAEPSLSRPPLLLTARFLASRALPVAKKKPASVLA